MTKSYMWITFDLNQILFKDRRDVLKSQVISLSNSNY